MVNKSLVSNTDVSQAISLINPLFLKIINAVVIILIGFVIGKLVQKLTLTLFDMIELDKLLSKKIKIRNLSLILSKIFSFIVYLIAVVIALNKIEIATTIINTIVILLVIIILLFLIFGINDIFANFCSGVILRMRKNIVIGDNIRIKNKKHTVSGVVNRLSLLSLGINTGSKELVIIPNTLLLKSVITKIRKK